MNKRAQGRWEDFLQPDVLRSRLITASLFIAAFGLLEDSIVERIRGFFWHGFDEKGDLIDSEYQTEVLTLNRSPKYASLAWLKKMGAIEDTDIAVFERVKARRNHIAHRLPELLGNDGLPPDLPGLFYEMVALLRKIEVWWIKEVDIPTDPDFDGKDVSEAEIVPGPLIGLQLLCEIALGPEEQSRIYYDELRKLSGRDSCEG
jgi:hypothetical protein